MPHKVFNLGTLAATTEAVGVPLIPGIEPGGSRAGHPTKPALLIKDAYLEVIDNTVTTLDFNQMSYYLKLSQEGDMTPGLQLLVGIVSARGDNTTLNTYKVEQFGSKLAGLVFAPRLVGVRTVEVGTFSGDVDVHLDYERVDVPWMDWFIMWDFLDNVVDNSRDY